MFNNRFNRLMPHPGYNDVGSVVSAGASIIGGAMGSSAASDAADAQAQAAADAAAEQRREYDLNRQDLQPYREAGASGVNKLAYLLGLDVPANGSSGTPLSEAEWNKQNNPYGSYSGNWNGTPYNIFSNPDVGRSPIQHDLFGFKTNTGTGNGAWANRNGSYQDYLNKYNADNPAKQKDSTFGSLLKKFDQNDLNNDVVYQNGLKFGLDQGTGSIDARARASGSSDSGAVLKELTRYANDYGSTKANDAYNRYTADNNGIYNKLAGVAGVGQTATNTGVQAGQQSANNISNILQSAGNARSAGIIGANNAWSNAMAGVANQNWGYTPNAYGSGPVGTNGAGGTGIIWN